MANYNDLLYYRKFIFFTLLEICRYSRPSIDLNSFSSMIFMPSF